MTGRGDGEEVVGVGVAVDVVGRTGVDADFDCSSRPVQGWDDSYEHCFPKWVEVPGSTGVVEEVGLGAAAGGRSGTVSAGPGRRRRAEVSVDSRDVVAGVVGVGDGVGLGDGDDEDWSRQRVKKMSEEGWDCCVADCVLFRSESHQTLYHGIESLKSESYNRELNKRSTHYVLHLTPSGLPKSSRQPRF